MIRKKEKAKRAIRRTKTKFEKILCQERLQQIYRAAEMAARFSAELRRFKKTPIYREVLNRYGQ